MNKSAWTSNVKSLHGFDRPMALMNRYWERGSIKPVPSGAAAPHSCARQPDPQWHPCFNQQGPVISRPQPADTGKGLAAWHEVVTSSLNLTQASGSSYMWMRGTVCSPCLPGHVSNDAMRAVTCSTCQCATKKDSSITQTLQARHPASLTASVADLHMLHFAVPAHAC